MQVNSYLTFDGRCEAAFKFYEKVLGGKIEAMIPHEGTPAAEHVPADWRKKIIHARLILGDKVLMGSDAPPDRYEPMKGFSVTLGIDDPAEAERVFHALGENGTVQMSIQQTFWAARFGMLVDKFGTPWMINCEQAAQAAAWLRAGRVERPLIRGTPASRSWKLATKRSIAMRYVDGFRCSVSY
jgi:PhnB protein